MKPSLRTLIILSLVVIVPVIAAAESRSSVEALSLGTSETHWLAPARTASISSSPTTRRVGPGAGAELPLRLAGQLEAHPGQLTHGVEPAHLLHRALRALELARVLTHHRLPQGLSAGGVGQPETPA